jgi:hypothetical protein
MTDDFTINQRTEMKCKGCGQFSSAQYCYACSTNPLGVQYAVLQAKLREYLALKSIDGVAQRQTLRKELAEMVK